LNFFGYIAGAIGNPQACRALGMANGKKPDFHHCALSPDHRQQRNIDRIRRRTVTQKMVVIARKGEPPNLITTNKKIGQQTHSLSQHIVFICFSPN
jgi:hypothetical protein